MENFKCIAPDWEEIQELALNVMQKIRKQDFHPDILVAISRGGLVPGRILADYLHIKDVISVKADHWGITATKNGKAKISYGVHADLSKKNVLLVDDVTDTGQSMELAKEHLQGMNAAVVKTATLYHLENSKHVPDFFGKEIPWVWIIFPWNYREDLVNLINKLGEEEKVPEKLVNELKENFDVSIKEEKLQEIIEHIDYLKEKGKI